MLPAGVESNVEEILKKICRTPSSSSQASAARESRTASSAGVVRDFSATTTASTSPRSRSRATPKVWTTRMPSRRSVLQRSVAPVTSSAIAPSRGCCDITATVDSELAVCAISKSRFFEGRGRMMTRFVWRATAVFLVTGALAAVSLLLLARDSGSQSASANAATARLAHAAVLERDRAEEAAGGADAEAYTDRAFPGDEVSIDQIQGALAANDVAGARGAKLGSKWDFIGPETLDVDRLGTQSFIKPTQWSGRVTALAVDPKCKPQECTLYLGAAGGGLWRTKNALAQNPSWKQISDGIPTNAIGSIAVDPNDATGKTVYVGTGEGNASGDSEAGLGLYKTTDDGAHWARVDGSFAVANNRAITWVAIEKGNANHILLGTRSGVRGIGSNSTSAWTLAGQSPAVGIYNSTDGGASFSLSAAGSFNEVKFDPSDPSTVYAAEAAVGLIR